MKSWKNISVLCVFSLFAVIAIGWQSNKKQVKFSELKLLPSLPVATELKGYYRFLTTDKYEGKGTSFQGIPIEGVTAGISALRQSDNLHFTIWTVIAKTPKEIQSIAQDTVEIGSNKLLPSDKKGRKIGQYVWRSHHLEEPHSEYRLITYDDRAIVIVVLMQTNRKSVNGQPVAASLTKADLEWADQLAMQTLDRLTAMGWTSKPANSASSRAKREVRERSIAKR